MANRSFQDILADIGEIVRADQARRRQTPEERAAALDNIGDIDYYGLLANVGIDRDTSIMSEPERLLYEGNFNMLRARYGDEVANHLISQTAQAGREVVRDATRTRTRDEAALDFLTAFPQSVAGIGTGILGAAGGLVDERLGTTIAKGGEVIQDFFSNIQSDQLNAARRLHAARMSFSQRENLALAEREAEQGRSGVGFRRFLRDMGDSLASNLADPTLLGQGAADAISSMLVSGGLATLLKGAGKTLVRRKVAEILAQKQAGTITAEAAKQSLMALERRISAPSWMLAVAAMEGGGAYQDTVLDVMARSHEELLQTSEPYRNKVEELVRANVPRPQALEQAQVWLANQTGLAAAGTQAVAAGAISRLAMGGAQPTRLRPLKAQTAGRQPRFATARALARDVGEETLEEGLQGASGTLASNIALQRQVDPDQDILEGVGQAVGEGGLYGALSAGGLKAPGAVLRGTGKAATFTMTTGKRAAERGRKILEQHQEASPVGIKTLSQETEGLKLRSQEDLQVLYQSIDNSNLTDEEKASAKEHLSSLVQALEYQPTGHEEILPEEVQQKLSQTQNRIEALEVVAEAFVKEKDEDNKLALAIQLRELYEPFQRFQEEPPYLEAILADEGEAGKILEDYGRIAVNANNTNQIRKAFDQATRFFEETTGISLTEENLNTPEGERGIQREITQAMLSPGTGNLQNQELILKHAEDGKLNLTPEQLAALRGSRALLRAKEEMEEDLVRERATKAGKDPAEVLANRHLRIQFVSHREFVSAQIAHGQPDKGAGRLPSTAMLLDAVVRAMQAGNKKLAQDYLTHLAKFAQHFSNKVRAINKHYEAGDNAPRVSYMQLTSDGRWMDSSTNPNEYEYKGLFVNRYSVASIEQAQFMAAEAKLVHGVLQGLAEAFPELEVPLPTLQELHPDLQGDPQELVQKFRKAREQERKKNQEKSQEQAKERTQEQAQEPPVQEPPAPQEPPAKDTATRTFRTLRDRYAALSPQERIQRFYRDTNTRLLLRRGFERLPKNPNRPLVAHISVEGVKYVNDHVSHESADGLYSIVARELQRIFPDAAKIGGDFAVYVKDQAQLDRVLKRINAVPELQGLTVTGAVGKTFEEAGRAHGQLKAQLELEGKRAERGERPFGLKGNGEFQKVELADQALPQGLQESFDKLSLEEQVQEIYYDTISNLLSNEGLRFLDQKAFRISIDADNLWSINDRYGPEVGDQVLAAVAQLAEELGASEHDLAHVSGDEYRGQSDSKKSLEAFGKRLAEEAEKRISIRAKNRHTGVEEIVQGVGISFGVGKTDEEADKALNRHKEQRAAQGLRGEEAFERRIRPAEGTGSRETAESRDRSAPGREAVQAEGQDQALVEEPASEPNREFFPGMEVQDRFPYLINPHNNMAFKTLSVRVRNGKPATRTFEAKAPLSLVRNSLENQDTLNDTLGKPSEKRFGKETAKEYKNILKSDPETPKKLPEVLRRAKQAKNPEEAERILREAQNVGGLMTVMVKNLRQALYRKNKKGQTLADGILKGLDANRWVRGKVLNVVEKTENGTLRYNPELLQLAVLAGIQWWLTMSQRESHLHEADLQSLTKLEDVPPELAVELDQGMGTEEVVRSLASVIARFWNVQAKRDGDLSYTEGIPGAMAAEVLRAMVELGMLEKVVVEVGKYHSPPTKEVIHRYRAKKWDQGENPIYSYPDVIEEVVVVEPEKLSYYGNDQVPVIPHQLGNPNIRLSKKQRLAQENQQATEFFIDIEMAEFSDALGEEGWIYLLSEPTDEEDLAYNRNHLEAVKGRNNQIVGAFREFQRIREEMQLRADQEGIPIDKLAKKYAYAITSVNRSMMLGRYNPQASKLMRELILPTWSTLDLSDEKSQQYQDFLLAVGQALDFGVKLNKHGYAEVVQRTREFLQGDLAPVIEMVRKWRKDKDFDLVAFKSALETAGVTPTPLAVHAILEVARLQDTKDRKNFRTSLYLEADGITNGPFNTLGLLNLGRFTSSWVENIKKGGVSIGNEAKTADQLFTETGADLYETAKNHTEGIIATLLKRIRAQEDGQKIHDHSIKLFDLLELLDMDLALIQGEDGDISVQLERGSAKSPMTVKVYGSGTQGLSNQIAKEIETALYEKITGALRAQNPAEGAFPQDTPAEAQRKYQRLIEALDAITGRQIGYSRKNQKFFLWDRLREEQAAPASKRLADLENFKLTPGEIRALQMNLRILFVQPMEQGILETLGPSIQESGQLIVGASTVQSVVLRKLYRNAIAKKLREKGLDPDKFDWKPGDFLSREELDQIRKELSDVSPQFSVDGQPFVLTKESRLEFTNEKGNTVTPVFSRALNEEFLNHANVVAPDAAGVSGIPRLVQGLGDARMMREFYQEVRQGTMQVYDGINVAIDKIRESGLAANEAALTAWQGNLFAGLERRLDKFLKNKDVLEALRTDDELVLEVTKALFLPLEDHQKVFTPEELRKQLEDYLRNLVSNIRFASLDMQARRAALASMALSVDQMASTYTPFLREGESLPLGSTAEDIANHLNEKYDAILEGLLDKVERTPPVLPISQETYEAQQKLVARTEEAQEASQKPAQPQRERIRPSPKVDKNSPLLKLGRSHKSGVRVLGQSAIRQMVRVLGLNDHEKQMVGELLRSKSLDGWKVVIGTPAQIRAYQESQGIPVFDGQAGQAFGAAVPAQKTIFLMTTDTETAVHEMIHAATFATLLAYYQGEDLGERSQEIKEAIQRLEKLRDRFLAIQYDAESDSPLDQAHHHAVNAIMSQELNPNLTPAEAKAASLNEFMAWTLANRQLARELSKTKISDTQEGQLVKIAKRAWKAIRSLIWGRKWAPKYGDDMLSQIRMNTAIITRSRPTVGNLMRENALLHSIVHGPGNERLRKLRESFNRLIVDNLPEEIFPKTEELKTRVPEHLITANELARRATDLFGLNPEEAATFRSIVAAFATEAKLDPQSMMEANRLFVHVIETLDAGDFVPDSIPRDSEAYTVEQRYHLDKVDFLLGKDVTGKDESGRSLLLPVFIGLALTSEEFARVLAKKEVPKALQKEGKSFDDVVANQGRKLMRGLSSRLSGLRKPAHVQEAIEQLSEQMVEFAVKEREELEKTTPNTIVNRLNDHLVNGLDRAAEFSFAKGKQLRESDALGRRLVGAFLQGMSAFLSEDQNQIVSQEVAQWAERGNLWAPIMELINDIVGRTKDIAEVYDLIKWVKSAVNKVRQDYRDMTPRAIRSKFSEKLLPETWNMLYQVMGRYDLASLEGLRGSTRKILELASDRKEIQKEIRNLERQLRQSLHQNQWNLIDQKIDQLVHFIKTGEPGSGLLANAFAISRLFGVQTRQKWEAPSDAVVNQIDQLITLRLLDLAEDHDREVFADLVEREREGMEFLLDYLFGQRKTELEKMGRNTLARVNHFKGHLPSEQKSLARIIVIEDSKAGEYRALGYRRIGDYRGSNIESGKVSRGYYYSPDAQQAPFSQGIIQNIDYTAYGVHEYTGYSTGPTAGLITDPVEVKRLASRMHLERGTVETLRPIFNAQGQVVAFERTLDPEVMNRLHENQDLSKMIGYWRGRQIEEILAKKANTTIIDTLWRMYDEDVRENPGNQELYVDLFGDDLDPVIKDAVSLFPPELVDQIRARFPDGFYVRKRMVNDVIGYRQASVGDMWTGNTRWPKEVQKGMKEVLIGLLGIDAYQLLIKSERNVKAVVAAAKDNIVARSLLIPAVNIISNYLQLLGRGMGPVDAAKGMLRGLSAIDSYVKSVQEQVKLEAELWAAENQPAKKARIEARLKAIQDAQRRMAIWPLIDAGEFSTIQDLGVEREDLNIAEGTVVGYIRRKVDELPPGIPHEMVRHLYMTKDTSLYQGLQKIVQYGDFVAKAALFDFYTKKKGMSQEEALGRISEEFINYDALPGRSRGYLESMGAVWFMNYKLRGMKVAASMIRNNPLQALLGSFMNYPMGIGTPITENLLAKLSQGTLGFSIGPRMAWQGVALHPVYNLVLD